jgi:hypothetical protein
VVEERDERAEVTGDVEEPERLVVEAEVGPGEALEELVEGADPAGQDEEAVCQLRHQHLALVHRRDDAEIVEAIVRDLAVDEPPGEHAGDVPARAQGAVGHRPH